MPLFNLYAIRKDHPEAINPANGDLTGNRGQATNLTANGLKEGVNLATLDLLQLLEALKNTVPLG